MTNFEIAALVRVAMMLCAVFVILIGAVMVWKLGDRAKEGNVRLASMEFRQVSTGLIVIGFGVVLMIVAIQKPLTVSNGGADVAAVIAPVE